MDFQHIPKISCLDQGYVYSLTKKASFKTKLYNLILKKNDVDIGEESVKQISFKAFIYHTYLFILNSSYKLTYWNWLISGVRKIACVLIKCNVSVYNFTSCVPCIDSSEYWDCCYKKVYNKYFSVKAIFSVKAQCEAEDVSEGIRRNKPKNEVPSIAYYHKYFAIF